MRPREKLLRHTRTLLCVIFKKKTLPVEKLVGRLVTVLERCRDRWNPKELAELARHLREFADSFDSQKGTKKTKKE